VQEGYTALLYASRKGHTEIVEMLLAIPDVDVNRQNTVRTLLSPTLLVEEIQSRFFFSFCIRTIGGYVAAVRGILPRSIGSSTASVDPSQS